jgi:hypothetical protein
VRQESPLAVFAQAVMQLFTSRDDQRNWARAVAMMRNGFGGHRYGALRLVQAPAFSACSLQNATQAASSFTHPRTCAAAFAQSGQSHRYVVRCSL